MSDSAAALIDLVCRLNGPASFPAGAGRRNDPRYELVSYLNNLIAFLLASNLENAAIFIRRARVWLDRPRKALDETYSQAASALLDLATVTVMRDGSPTAQALLNG